MGEGEGGCENGADFNFLFDENGDEDLDLTREADSDLHRFKRKLWKEAEMGDLGRLRYDST